MNKKQLTILFSVAVGLIIILTGKLLWQHFLATQVFPLQTKLNGLTADAVNKIVLKNATDKVTLKHTGSLWFANDFPADSQKINALLMAVKSLQLTDITSTQKNNWEALNISQGKALELTFYKTDNQNPLTVFVSSDGENIRQLGNDTVYSLATPFTQTATLQNWENLTILQIQALADIKELLITNTTGESYTLIQNNNAWTLNNNQIQADKISSLTGNLLNVSAEKLLTVSDALSYMQSAGVLKAVLVSDKKETTISLSFFGPVNNEYLVKKDGDSRLFLMSSAMVGQLLPSLSSLSG